MAADIYTLFRSAIGGQTPDYTLADLNVLKYLDKAIDKLSATVNYTVVEDVTISQEDIDAGYKDLTHEIEEILSTELGTGAEDVCWEQAGGKRINFVKPDMITAGTYEFRYAAKYKKFDGQVRENDYFDYPREADLGIVFYALSLYVLEGNVIKVDGDIKVITSKSEEGQTVSYATSKLTTPLELQGEAIKIFRSMSNAKSINFSVSV